jgi:acyl phosphate:glycerol-3-phosphate acyltransferase
MVTVLVVVAAYLIGSIPSGYLIVSATQGKDVRETGSGGTGATNVTRSAGKAAGVATLVLDALKGFVAVEIARTVASSDATVNWSVALASVAVVVGHCFPVWLRFRGGKGVATGAGVFLALFPLGVLCTLLILLPIVWITRYVSLGSIVAAASFPVFVFFLTQSDSWSTSRRPLITTALAVATLIVFMHRENIGRLIRGTENKLK